MSKNALKMGLLGLGLAVGLSLPAAAYAASDTGWTQSSKLYEIRTWAGKSEPGHINGAFDAATFQHPRAALALPDGRLLVSDGENHYIRVVSAKGTSDYAGTALGEDETGSPLGGYHDDVAAKSAFNRPAGLAIDGQGIVYVADSDNHAIRAIAKDGKVTTLAGNGKLGLQDGVGAEASFHTPLDVAADGKGNVYVADTLNHVIRKIDAAGKVTTLTAPSTRIFEYFPGAVDTAGDYRDGKIAEAKFNEPSGLALDTAGNLYVSDRGNQRIRYIDFKAGTVTTVAGGGSLGEQDAYVQGEYVDGAAAASRFNAPEGLTVAPDGSVIVADSLNHAIRLIKNGKVTTLAGIPEQFGKADGVAGHAQFNHPTDVTLLADGRLVIVDEFGNKVRALQKYAKPAAMPSNQIAVLLNGKLLPSDVPAQIRNNAVLLPVRSVGNALGYKVGFDAKTGAALLSKDGVVYTIKSGSGKVTKTVGGKTETIALNAPAIDFSKRMFIPVRFFATESGLDIQWDAAGKAVIIRNYQF